MPPRIDPDLFEAGVTPGSDRVDVYLDGRPLTTCVKANRRAGWATCLRIGADGEVERDGFDRVKTTVHRGRVEFRTSR